MPPETQNIDEAKQSSFNRNIEGFLMTSQMLELDFEFGFQQLNMYLQDVMFRDAGYDFKDLGVSERRHAAAPTLLIPSDSSANGYLVDKWDMMDGNVPHGSIAHLKLSGVMRTQSSISSPGVDSLARDMRAAYNNPKIAGVIVEGTSGGGESMAGNVLKSAFSEKNKPTVMWGHLLASAAFRAATGADEIIMSSPQAEAGSIGTMISMDMKELNKFRERFTEFYGTDAPNKNGDFRRAMAGDFTAIQERVDALTREFHKEIKRDRPLQGDAAMIKETLSGAMFNAVEAKRRGLVDAIGNLNFAIRRVNALKSTY